MPMTLHAVLLDFLDEFEGMEPDRFTVVFRQAFMVGGEYTESLRCAYELLDWQAKWRIHTSRLHMRAGVAYSDNPMSAGILSE